MAHMCPQTDKINEQTRLQHGTMFCPSSGRNKPDRIPNFMPVCGCGCLCVRTAELPDVLERCCDVGRRWFATNRERCTVYPSTVPGVGRADRAACSAVIDLCCMSQRQDRQCTLGKQSARLRRSCSALSSRPGSEHARVCQLLSFSVAVK